MKLSQLETLVAAMRAATAMGADPEVTLYKNREATDGPAGPLESAMFIEWDLVSTPLAEGESVVDYQVGASWGQCRAQKDDFNLPVARINNYTS